MFGVCLDIDIDLPLYIPGKYFYLHITLHWSAYLIIFDKSRAMFTSLLTANAQGESRRSATEFGKSQEV